MKLARKINYVTFLPIAGVLAFSALVWHYVNLSARDLIFMDYWRYASELIPRIMEHDFSPMLLWKDCLGHRNPLIYSLFALDIKFFNFNCLWECYFGVIVIACTSLLLLKKWQQIIKTVNYNKPALVFLTGGILFIFFLLPLFNLNQWEILSLQFSGPFMVRIFFYIIIFILLDNMIINKVYSIKKNVCLGILIALVICLMSQLYWCAMVITCSFMVATLYMAPNTNRLSLFKSHIALYIPILIGIGLYLYDIHFGASGEGSSLKKFFGLFANGDFFISLSYALLSIVLHQDLFSDFSTTKILVCGFAIMLAIGLAIFLFFKTKMYKISFLPLALMSYGLITIPILIYGRASMFDLKYLSASRYTCETSLIILGVFMCYSYALTLIIFNNSSILQKSLKLASILTVHLTLVCSLTASFNKELQIAPYRGYYKDDLLKYVNEVSKADVQEKRIDLKKIALLQSDPESVKATMQYILKYDIDLYFNNSVQAQDIEKQQ
jgi:hypothetical protein